jgi:hypothetical protein
MNETHKGHNIVISASRSGDTRQWKPHVKIIWSEDSQGEISTLNVNGAFGARREAEMGKKRGSQDLTAPDTSPV